LDTRKIDVALFVFSCLDLFSKDFAMGRKRDTAKFEVFWEVLRFPRVESGFLMRGLGRV
jgi:hypothetical protein